MITMKKTKGLLALAIGVALCFAVSAYALTAPQDTQDAISDNASAQPVEEPWWKNEDILPVFLMTFPILTLLKKQRTLHIPPMKQAIIPWNMKQNPAVVFIMGLRVC